MANGGMRRQAAKRFGAWAQTIGTVALLAGCTSGTHVNAWSAPTEVEKFGSQSKMRLRAEMAAYSIVAFGENHEDGSSVGLKTELVKYLHREAGFDRVVVEAGLFSVREMERAMARGASVSEAARLGIHGRGLCSEEAYSLWKYVASTRNTSRPLRISGVDPQLTGRAPRERLVASLERALSESVDPRTREAIVHLFDLNLKRTREERETDRELLAALQTRVGELLGDDSFWLRVVDGLRFLDVDHWDFQQRGWVAYEMASARDLQMARNLLWLRRQHPHERMVLLAANTHIMRKSWMPMCPHPEHDHGDQDFVPMGQTLSERLGSDYFAVALSAASGRTGRPGSDPVRLTRAVPVMVEYPALEGAEPWTFISGLELREHGRSSSAHLAPSPLEANWGERFDGLIAFREMAPHTRRDTPECAP